MTLLDRFRAGPRHKHPDPVVRLAHVAELPLSDRETIDAIAREDEDARVRRAAVGKLMDPGALGRIARDDQDADVRAAAASMLRDIALEAFEGIGEAEALDAVDVLTDAPILAQIAKTAGGRSSRSVPCRASAIRAISGRSRAMPPARPCGAGRCQPSATGATRAKSSRSRCTPSTRTRPWPQSICSAGRPGANRRQEQEPAGGQARPRPVEGDGRPDGSPPRNQMLRSCSDGGAEAIAGDQAELAATRREAAAERPPPRRPRLMLAPKEGGRHRPESGHERARARLEELASEIEAAVMLDDPAERRKRMAHARSEWDHLSPGTDTGIVADRVNAAVAQWVARENEAREAEERARRDALARLQALLRRVEPLVDKADVSAKAADRALRDIRAALADVPPLPSKAGLSGRTRRLKAVQAALQPKLQELREAEEWQRWANATIQEQLCAKMEALQALDDPDRMAAKCGTCSSSGARPPTFRAHRPTRSGAASRRRTTSCGRGARRSLPRGPRRSAKTSAARSRSAKRPRRSPTPRTGSRPRKRSRRSRRSGRRLAPSHAAARRRSGNGSASPATASSHGAARISRGGKRSGPRTWRRRPRSASGPKRSRHLDGVGRRRGRDQAAAGRVEDDRPRQEDAVRGHLAALPRGMRSVLHELRPSARHGSGARASPRARLFAGARSSWRPAGRGRRPGEVLAAIRASARTRWKQETAARRADPRPPERLDERFAAAFAQICARWPDAIRGTDSIPTPIVRGWRRSSPGSRSWPVPCRAARLSRRDQSLSPTDPARRDVEGSARVQHHRRRGGRSQPEGGGRRRGAAGAGGVARIGPVPDAVRDAAPGALSTGRPARHGEGRVDAPRPERPFRQRGVAPYSLLGCLRCSSSSVFFSASSLVPASPSLPSAVRR